MGLSENSDDRIFKRHNDLCNNLNMDSTTTLQAWESYESIRKHYSLEGDQLHWLGCAIYVACRRSTIPTVGQTTVVKGNCVSFTRLLRLCNLSVKQFFNKCTKWCDMANMPTEFRKRINCLERNFAVSFVVFKKYHTIFTELFQTPVDDQPKQHRSRKQRNLPCTPARIFEFCWTLFVAIKGEFAICSDDLVMSFHLLLACCDMAFSNALLADRRDLLNPNFAGLPASFSSSEYVKPAAPPCIIDLLCQHFDGIVVDAKWVKEYSWKPAVMKLFQKNILHGDAIHFSGLFDSHYFDANDKAVNKVYEEHVLSVGEFDEKIFLAEYRRMQLISKQASFYALRSALQDLNTDGDVNAIIGSPNRPDDKTVQGKRDFSNQYADQMKQLFPATPLTGRRYLQDRDAAQRNAPLQSATQCVIRLQTMLAGRQPEPSEELREIFRSCTRDPTDGIRARVKDLGDRFRTHYTQQQSSDGYQQPNGNVEIANKYLALSETLYYKLLENVIQEEKNRNPNIDITVLLEQDTFHRCMFACSIEIVIYSYNCQRKFPWILQALDLKAYYFFRVIELIVRTKDQLSRDVVKHLNSIEEQTLESIAWESDSPLWQCIEQSNRPVPSCQDTALPNLPNQEGPKVGSHSSAKLIQTPTTSVQQSPISSATERFQSPISNNFIKKKLLFDSTAMKVKPGQSVLHSSSPRTVTTLVVLNDKGNQQFLPIMDLNYVTQQPPPPPPAPAKTAASNNTPVQKPKRNGSLALFFRKFYSLAGVRMEFLCEKLGVTDTKIKQKMFTCFEHCITENTDLMKDRHLDQILMCSVYVVLKNDTDKAFTKIMQCYRLQPQADSHVYRSVLLSKRSSEEKNDKEKSNEEDSGSKASTTTATTRLADPNELACTSTNHNSEERGDLIVFYNLVFIQRIQNFAIRFYHPNQSENIQLSPLPNTKNHNLTSPKRRVMDNVFVRPYAQMISSPNASKHYNYYFSRSPSKDLQNINSVINSCVGKRLLTGNGQGDNAPPIKVPRKLQGLLEERLGQTKE